MVFACGDCRWSQTVARHNVHSIGGEGDHHSLRANGTEAPGDCPGQELVDAISVDRSLPWAVPRSLGAIGAEAVVVSLTTDGVNVVSSNCLTPAAISTSESHDEGG